MFYFKNDFWRLRLIAVIAITAFAVGCSKSDEYKKYTTGKELTYTGRTDSVKAFSGRNRVLITWLIMADPNVASAKVYWNGKNDSTAVTINRTTGVDTIKVVVNNLAESNYNFEIVTYDKIGNHSVTVNKQAAVYGAVYENTLLNRLVRKAELVGDDVQINWYAADALSIGTEISYEKQDGGIAKLLVPTTATATTLPGYKNGSKFDYRTLYRPDSTAIDTFYSAKQSKGVIADVTSLYIKNAGFPFRSAGLNGGGRFGNLADWTVNDAAKNQGGFGGFDNAPGYGALSMEYWGTPAINNGKIYQTATLQPGKYVFTATVQNIDYEIASTYLLAATGATLPNSADYGSGLGFAKFTNNSQNGKDVSLSFSLTAETEVSMGLTSTMNTGTQSLRLKGFKLVYTPE